MTHCHHCATCIDSSDAMYTSAGEPVCGDCFDDSRIEDPYAPASSEEGSGSSLGTIFGAIAFACALTKLALTLVV